MHAVVAFGGDADPAHVRQVLARAQLIIAADGGAAHVEAAGGVCDVIVGDQDSAPAATLDRALAAGADIRDFPTAKDATDGELALREALSRGASSITIVGALGGPRVDHLLANVALLAHPDLRRVDAVIEDARYRIWLVSGSSSWRGAAGDCVTLLAVGGDAHGVTTPGPALCPPGRCAAARLQPGRQQRDDRSARRSLGRPQHRARDPRASPGLRLNHLSGGARCVQRGSSRPARDVTASRVVPNGREESTDAAPSSGPLDFSLRSKLT